MATSGTLQVEWVERSRLFPNPSNPRHNDAAVPHVAASLRRFGWQQPIVAKPSGEVIAGHTRLRAAEDLGQSSVPVVWFEGSDLDAKAFGIADNRSSEFASWDEEALARLLQELEAEDALDGVGFDGEELAALVATVDGPPPPTGEDVGAQEPPEDPVSRPGDLWLLGDHRLLCGDSTTTADVTRLMNGDLATWVWTDPPYGVNYTGGTGLSIQNDDPEGLPDLLAKSFTTADSVMAPGCPIYVAHPAGPLCIEFLHAFTATGWKLHETLIWVKNSLVLGHSDYHYRHEPVLYGWKGKNRRWYAGRDQDTVFEVARPSRSEDHPTSKPVELITAMLRNSARRGDIGYEPFSGSGSTLMAAQELGLHCRAMELDPRYVDAAVRRWQATTGDEAMLEATGQTFAAVASKRS